jgi:hypothetical protein
MRNSSFDLHRKFGSAAFLVGGRHACGSVRHIGERGDELGCELLGLGPCEHGTDLLRPELRCRRARRRAEPADGEALVAGGDDGSPVAA